jgi:hypothetical protein
MEEYRVIKDFENYSVSSFGNVKNNLTNKILKPRINNRGYYQLVLRNNNKDFTKKVHRLVAETFIPNCENKSIVDHIDNNRLNNNINNLRWATISENSMNRQITSKNTSGIKGVGFCLHSNHWVAYIKMNGKQKGLGHYETKEEALEARLKAVEKYFGEYANKCEKELILNIKMPKQSKLKITVNIDSDEEYKNLEKEFEEMIKN